ncbi:MAG: TRAP transporter small permease [Hyphomicrobium sp.]|uniref:TRAP transporter small permease n=1 Tax=Hyphomicrobium sp. CS1BSMeth3 TaxID=1892844 RepID=UPI0015775BE1|nr:TRAP transporter small permease [Hyphomicrobium sp. CS1BSMeth3]MBN9266262.1 TRAP transporter small permease [Hyphomicrobium sp.]MBN9276011.1 TRAP transporter small permease [Hyphomicrobium sp.]
MLDRALHIFDVVERGAMLCAAFAIFVIMLVVGSDVFMRYVFNAPIELSYELISRYLMVAAFFLAVSSTFKAGGHISVDFFCRLMTPRMRMLSEAAVNLMVLPVLLTMGITGLLTTVRAYNENDIFSGAVDWPVWLSNILVPIGIGILCIRVVIRTIELVLGKAADLAAENAEPQDDGI